MYKIKLVLKIQETIKNNLKYPRGAFRTQTSETEIFHKNSQQPRAVNSFHRKTPPPMLDQTLNNI